MGGRYTCPDGSAEGACQRMGKAVVGESKLHCIVGLIMPSPKTPFPIEASVFSIQNVDGFQNPPGLTERTTC